MGPLDEPTAGTLMETKLTCCVLKFGQLGPFLLRSVTPPSEFTLGIQAIDENRVDIRQASEDRIVSEVTEGQHKFTQTIQLKDRRLEAQCSCPQAGRLLCRHCVAVLVGVYRLLEKRTPPPAPEHSPSAGAGFMPKAVNSILDLSSQDIAQFVNWMEQIVPALEKGKALPPIPDLGSDKIKRWVQALQNLETRARRSDEKGTALAISLDSHVTQIKQALSQMYANLASLYDQAGEREEAEKVRGSAGPLQPS